MNTVCQMMTAFSPHSELDRIEEQLMTREAEVALIICQSSGITELYIYLRTGLVHFFFFLTLPWSKSKASSVDPTL